MSDMPIHRVDIYSVNFLTQFFFILRPNQYTFPVFSRLIVSIYHTPVPDFAATRYVHLHAAAADSHSGNSSMRSVVSCRVATIIPDDLCQTRIYVCATTAHGRNFYACRR